MFEPYQMEFYVNSHSANPSSSVAKIPFYLLFLLPAVNNNLDNSSPLISHPIELLSLLLGNTVTSIAANDNRSRCTL